MARAPTWILRNSPAYLVAKGQPAAAQALGLTYSQTMRYVVLPQAFRNMLPVLLTQTIVLFQDTSLVYVLSIPDFLGPVKFARVNGKKLKPGKDGILRLPADFAAGTVMIEGGR